MNKIVLIDGNALVHRAFHALPALTSAKGVVTNAVYGFTSILLKMIRDIKPKYIAATFDLAGPTFRHEQFEEYKSHRIKAPDELYKQIPLVKKVLATFGIPVYELQGYEADDLIGTLAARAKKEKDTQVIIVTGDLDTLQLVDNKKVMVYTLRKGMTDTVMYDADAVFARYGLTPVQLNDFRGLKGDPSDNIPGVPGIGEKTAAQIIQKFGSLDGLYKAIEGKVPKFQSLKFKSFKVSDKLKEKLLANKDQAYFSKQLSQIICDLEVDFSLAKADWQSNLNIQKIESIFKDLAFFSLIKRLPEIGLTGQGELDLNAADKSTETDADQPELLDGEVIVVSSEDLTEQILQDPKTTIIGHDLKSLIKEKIMGGAEIKCKMFDTKIAAYLLNPEAREYDWPRIFYGEFKKDPNNAASMKTDLAKLKEKLEHKLRSSDLMEVFEKIEMPLIKVLAEMELNGIKIDTSALANSLKTTNSELAKLEKRIYKLAGTDFNINSPRQLAEILFNRLRIIGRVRKTGGGKLSTAAPELEKLRDEHPIIDLILQYRELQKLKTTYIKPFPQLVDKNGRVHTTYVQTGTATGRLSSQDPNLQNIPIKTKLGQEFRRAFIAEFGYQIVSFDYSQLELRIVAHIANDKKMTEAFQKGEDIHTRTASEIFEVSPDKVTKKMRRQAKVLNFGIIFGMGAMGFSRASGVDRTQAKEFINKYFAEFSGVARYMEEIKNQAHRQGYVSTIFGRRRPFLDIYSTMPQIQAGAERAAINHPTQGTAADIVKLAMNKVYDWMHKSFKSDEIKMLLQIHDEIVFEIKKNLVKNVVSEIKQIMENITQLKVPLIVEAKSGNNWEDIRPVA